ncbi:CHAP-domain-containing protein [Linderina pennispora]|uniref:CHAP-domain-containing protein n=1 Tax=Linderina pennispora TaxID=61395 RepID=A0A1Y1W788_9FUNG|nr:CHAP-domain-containing protein [Linderina pennispora]XP_040743120.1 CHAP-domain-containing protein [Linderina pennispora]XP_040743148.1 CHAP-domain-containing protein [Linderina pennispora]ORX69391.1 CHAP-domain-containing protein [Linderina pennispora]ORX69432.1 CHAP-domain-containing protein [Linderina pennispora]ORX69460.1 CHAP-domain-containing protein [Linderina pennispora]
MKFTAAATLLIATISPLVSAYPIYKADVVNCRSSPGTSGEVVKTYAKDTEVEISCQISGDTVKGNALWDKTQDGCYVSDYYIKTGSSGYVSGRCSGGSTGGGSTGGGSTGGGSTDMKDDYPYKNNCGPVDKWSYYQCQCTSFVAWRINSRLGINFHNRYKGKAWGNANEWDDAARSSGVTVSSTPKVGAVAQTNAGRFGHVAWVAKVDGDNVVVEEYNKGGTEHYGTRTVPKSSFNYIYLN